ncbi:F390 synthetase-related protein [Legionella sp. km772]|uniref:F390 synthetase-related protein n=1 Tax=Legionella sp. km772 TaxID=2498111 RepID=UPI000F8E9784|nr:F390 synthetase-related protein [Legionella sp. km772]RUR11155.1 CoF synthetase [Legionella sp. km772]
MLARILYYYAKSCYLKRRIKSVEQLKLYQDRQWEHLVKHCLFKSPFYRPYLNKPLHEWPIINKSIMMEHFNELNTLGITKQQAFEVALRAEESRDFSPLIHKVAVGLSSGTSGNRGLFLANPAERDAWAGTILAKALPQGLAANERIAFFLRANNNLYTTLNKGKKVQFYFFDLLVDFDEHIKKLNAIKPTILSAPASVLLLLAQQQERLTIQPKKIFSVAETLEKKDELIIAKAFNCRISQIYQATEGFLAISDKQTNRLTLNEEFLIIEKEWLDEKRFVPIITDLARTSQPIIRYRLDDILVYSENSHLFTELEAIEGRVGDICYANKEGNLIPIFADSIRQHMAKSRIKFDDYRIIQNDLNQFTIQISPELKDKDAMLHHLNQLFIQKQCDLPNWDWSSYNKSLISNKFRRIQSHFKPSIIV